MASLNPTGNDRFAEFVRSIPVERASAATAKSVRALEASADAFGHRTRAAGATAWAFTARTAHTLRASAANSPRLASTGARARSIPTPAIPVRTALLAFAVLVVISAAAVTAVQLVRGNDEVVAPVELSPAVVISNLSDGRDGRPFAIAGGEPLFPLPASSLAAFRDAPIEMQGVLVQAVVPNVGYWVGEDAAQRVFVVMRPAATADDTVLPLPELAVGQSVNLSGYLRVAPATAADAGITDPAQAQQFDRQKYRLEANSIRK